jgi:hypothetical protein
VDHQESVHAARAGPPEEELVAAELFM